MTKVKATEVPSNQTPHFKWDPVRGRGNWHLSHHRRLILLTHSTAGWLCRTHPPYPTLPVNSQNPYKTLVKSRFQLRHSAWIPAGGLDVGVGVPSNSDAAGHRAGPCHTEEKVAG